VSERPVRTVAQISQAVGCGFGRANDLLFALELMGLAEPAGAGYRRSTAAEQHYPVLTPAEVKRRQVTRRQEAYTPGQCVWCGRVYAPTSTNEGICSAKCSEEFQEMREAA
jgi:hypothetical protein